MDEARARKVKALAVLLLAISLATGVCVSTAAAVITLVDANSSVSIDPMSQAGMFDWTVDGVNHMNQQWFWFGVGSSPEASIDSLTLAGAFATDTNTRPGADTLILTYLGTGFEIQIKYSLLGGSPGSQTSDVTEQIIVTNTSGGLLDFHFFQYTDLDLGGTPGGDTATRPNANSVRQSDLSVAMSETVFTPAPSHFEIALVPTTITGLNDGSPTTLSDTAASLGPSNVTWALQWDRTLTRIGRGRTLVISEDMLLTPVSGHQTTVPEPPSGVLLGLGVLVSLAAPWLIRLMRFLRRCGRSFCNFWPNGVSGAFTPEKHLEFEHIRKRRNSSLNGLYKPEHQRRRVPNQLYCHEHQAFQVVSPVCDDA
jgi:hypothetical protein